MKEPEKKKRVYKRKGKYYPLLFHRPNDLDEFLVRVDAIIQKREAADPEEIVKRVHVIREVLEIGLSSIEATEKISREK